MKRLMIALALGLVAAGCGSGPGPDAGVAIRNRSVLTADEIRAATSSGSSVYDVLQRLRPEYLRSRGPTSVRNTTPTTAVVYVDDIRFGEIEALRTMGSDQIFEVRYINASDATTRFGTDHVGGAILITTKR